MVLLALCLFGLYPENSLTYNKLRVQTFFRDNNVFLLCSHTILKYCFSRSVNVTSVSAKTDCTTMLPHLHKYGFLTCRKKSAIRSSLGSLSFIETSLISIKVDLSTVLRSTAFSFSKSNILSIINPSCLFWLLLRYETPGLSYAYRRLNPQSTFHFY